MGLGWNDLPIILATIGIVYYLLLALRAIREGRQFSKALRDEEDRHQMRKQLLDEEGSNE